MTEQLAASGRQQQWYRRHRDGSLSCTLCAHVCRLAAEGERGRCGVRERRGERVESLVYGRLVAENVDPIEKKPLFHVLPGTLSYSIATAGCNFTCRHCQNATISQVGTDFDPLRTGISRTAEEVVAAALRFGCQSISYTYVEPTIFFEFAYDCCLAATAAGLKNVFVSNGYMTRSVIVALSPVLAAINIDLKSFRDSFYRQVCGARLAPVLAAIRGFRELGVWVEVTTLVIPGYNDSDQELREIAAFLYGVDPDIVWHVTGYYPAHRLTAPPTGAAVLARAREIGLEQGLRYVYSGNRPGVSGENTSCPGCRRELIGRQGFQVTANRLRAGHCPDCGYRLAGVWG
jgi:pyruvate formate lyase activating enzyme